MSAHPVTPREREVARAAYAQALVDGQFCDENQAVFRASVAIPEPRTPELPGGQLCECGRPRCMHFGREEYCTSGGFKADWGPKFRFSGKYERSVALPTGGPTP